MKTKDFVIGVGQLVWYLSVLAARGVGRLLGFLWKLALALLPIVTLFLGLHVALGAAEDIWGREPARLLSGLTAVAVGIWLIWDRDREIDAKRHVRRVVEALRDLQDQDKKARR